MNERDQPFAAPGMTPAGWYRVLPFLTYLLFIGLTELLQRAGWSAQDLRWLYAVKVSAVAALLAAFWRHYGELRWPARRPGRAAVALTVGIAVLVLWIGLDAPWMQIGQSDGFDPRTNGVIDWPLVVVRIAGAAIVVPVMEELFWRSFLLRWIDATNFETIDPAQVSWKSIGIGVLLFGFEHNLWLAGMIAGAAYSALYVRYRTLWPSVLAHAVTNLLLGLWIVKTGNWSYW